MQSSAWAGATEGMHRQSIAAEDMTRTNIRTVVEAKDQSRQSAAQLSANLAANVQSMLARERSAHDKAVFELKQARGGVEARELKLRDLLMQHRAMGMDPQAFLDSIAGGEEAAAAVDGKGDGYWGSLADGEADDASSQLHGESAAHAQTALSHDGLKPSASVTDKRAFVGALSRKLEKQQGAIAEVQVRGATVSHMLDRLVEETVQLRRHLHSLEDALAEERSKHAVLSKTRSAAEAALRGSKQRLAKVRREAAEVKDVWLAEIKQQKAFLSQKQGFSDFLGTVIQRQQASTVDVQKRVQEAIGPSHTPPSASSPATAPAPHAAVRPTRLQPLSSRRGTTPQSAQGPRSSVAGGDRASTARSEAVPGKAQETNALPVPVTRRPTTEIALVQALRDMGLLRVTAAQAPAPAPRSLAATKRAPPPPRTITVQTYDGLGQQEQCIVADEAVLRHQAALQLPSREEAAALGALDLDTLALLLNPPVLDAGGVLASCAAQEEVRRGLLRRRRAEELRIAKLGDKLTEFEREVASLGLGPGLRATNKVLMDRQSAMARAQRETEQLRSQLQFVNTYLQQVQDGLGRTAERVLGLPSTPAVSTPDDIETVAEAVVQRLTALIQETRRNFALQGENPNALAVPLRTSVDDGPEGGDDVESGAGSTVPPSMRLDMHLAESLYLSPYNLRVPRGPADAEGVPGTGAAKLPPAQTPFTSTHSRVPRPIQHGQSADSEPGALGPPRPVVRRGISAAHATEAEEDTEDGPVLDRSALKLMAGTLLRNAKRAKADDAPAEARSESVPAEEGALDAPEAPQPGLPSRSASRSIATPGSRSEAGRPSSGTSSAQPPPASPKPRAPAAQGASGTRFGGLTSLDE